MFKKILSLVNTKDINSKIKELLIQRNWKELMELSRAFPKEFIEYKDEFNDTVLHHLAKSGSSIHANCLWSHLVGIGAELHSVNISGNNAMHYALINGHNSYLESYVELIASGDKKIKKDSMLLQSAIEHSNFNFARRLLDFGYKPNENTIRSAVYEGQYDFVREAILKNRKLLASLDKNGNDLLYYACKSNLKDTRNVVAFLINQGICELSQDSYTKALSIAKDNNSIAYTYMFEMFKPSTPSANKNIYGLHDLDLVKVNYINLKETSQLNPVLSSEDKEEFISEIDNVIELANMVKKDIYARKNGKLISEYALMFEDPNLLSISLYAASLTEDSLKSYVSAYTKDAVYRNAPLVYALISYDMNQISQGHPDKAFALNTFFQLVKEKNYAIDIESLKALSKTQGFDLSKAVVADMFRLDNVNWISTEYANYLGELKVKAEEPLVSQEHQMVLDL